MVISILNSCRDSAEKRTRASAVGGEHFSKELFKQRINSYSEHLLYKWLHEHT